MSSTFVSRTQAASQGGSWTPARIYDLLIGQGATPAEATYLTYASSTHEDPSGNPSALNNDPGTGDYSVGLFQVNYYGSLLSGRTAEFGSPTSLAASPQAQARAALAIYKSQGPGAWPSSYQDLQAGKIKGYDPTSIAAAASSFGNAPGAPTFNVAGSPPSRPGVSQGGSGSLWGSIWGSAETAAGDVLGTAEGAAEGLWGATLGNLESTITDSVSFLKAAAWLIHPLTWLRIVEGVAGIGLAVGGLLVATGVAEKTVEALEQAAPAAAAAA